jgi:hypothetical protein
MPFETPEQALLFDIEFAVKRFRFASPLKKDRAAMSQWKEMLAAHVLEHLQRCGWRFERGEPREMGAGAIIPQKK